MEPITIHLKDESGFSRHGEAAQLGVPFARGKVTSAVDIRLRDPERDQTIPCQTAPMAHWPDGSIRWLKINFLANLAPHQAIGLQLFKTTAGEATQASPLKYQATEQEVRIETGKTTFRVPRYGLDWLAYTGQGAELHHEIRLSDQHKATCTPKLDSEWQVTESGPVYITLNAKGQWLTAEGTALARFDCHLRFYANSETADIEVCIHNAKRARHPGGLWDLGDPGSVHFGALAVHVKNPDSDKAWMRAEPAQSRIEGHAAQGLYLYQDSSGGDQWQSRNHVNAQGEITTRFRGYQVRSADKSLAAGDRASPIVALEGPDQTVQASIRQFWQNFPSALGTKDQELVIGLFPADSAEPYELQGGERKTQTVYLNYGTNSHALTWTQSPLVPTLEAEQYERAEAFPWFKANAPKEPLDELIREGAEGPDSFFAKREMIDEFGWRNFGDIFADHETLYQNADEPLLISHYNNQYDAIYGFARQFATTGDPRWHELMDDLANHVTDIDIYHTAEDRAEYNNGLFWHTDHYLDAHTATHRTFTRHNDTSSTPGQTGGGPASEHCYTTGLLYHYYMTGASASREAVLELANWIRTSYEGQGGLLEQLLAVKKHDLPKLKALLKGERPSPHRYPFTRGTGNYLNALLDASLLEPGEDWLNHAEGVIRRTIHPADNIEKRNLLVVETGWSYLILMTSIARYLYLKREAGNTDVHYSYAKAAFMHYAKWMLQNERPFLSDSEQLEFPNDTWVAQDVRKAMLMFQASELDPARTEDHQNKGNQWLTELCEALTQSKQKHYARILIILMQNYGPQHVSSPEGLAQLADGPAAANDSRAPRLTWGELAARIVGRLARGILAFRPAKERAWLQLRLDRN